MAEGILPQRLPILYQKRKLRLDGQQHGNTVISTMDQGADLEPVHARLRGRIGQEPPVKFRWNGLDAGGMKRPVEYCCRVVLDPVPDHGQGVLQAGVPLVAQIDIPDHIPAVQQCLQSQQFLPGLGGGQHDGQRVACHLMDQPPQMGQVCLGNCAINMGKQFHAVQVQKFCLCDGFGIFGTAVQGFQIHTAAQFRRERILGGIQQRQTAALQPLQPLNQLLPFRGVKAAPDILEIVEVHAIAVRGDRMGQEVRRSQGHLFGDRYPAVSGHSRVEMTDGIGIGTVHHSHLKTGLASSQTADDLPADFGLADACHAGDPSGTGPGTGKMIVQLFHNGIASHQWVDGAVRSGNHRNAAVGSQLPKEGGEGRVMLSAGIPDGVNIHLTQFLCPLLEFICFRHG